MIEEFIGWKLGEKMIEFSPFETVIAYSLAILIISGLITEYLIKLIGTKSVLTKVSSFMLLVFVFWHLVFVEGNSLVDSLLIVFALLMSFVIIILQKLLLWWKSDHIAKLAKGG